MDSICKCNGSREEAVTVRKGHIPESKQRWEEVIFGESSGGHCIQKQHHTPCGVQGQAFMPVLPHYAFLFLLPLHLTLPLHYRKQKSQDSKKNTY